MVQLTFLAFCASIALGLNPSFAAPVRVAIMDSGVDFRHPNLQGHQWVNPTEVPGNRWDDDHNGWTDDVSGWSFVELSPNLFDSKSFDKFRKRPKYPEYLQYQRLKHTTAALSPSEQKWFASKQKDDGFQDSLADFSYFVHGTHVAGIVAQNAPQSRLLSLTLIPPDYAAESEGDFPLPGFIEFQPQGIREEWVMKRLARIAQREVGFLTMAARYCANTGIEIANGSFGVPGGSADTIISRAYKRTYWHLPSPDQLARFRYYYMNQLVRVGLKINDIAPNTLFVFAAGNEAQDADYLPVFPGGIVEDNVISVAAIGPNDHLASFTNHGARTVSIAAPGTEITSSIPGGETLKLSGTSMAAPWVTAAAANAKEINPSLTPSQLKQILLSTVDRSAAYAGMVSSQGKLNSQRALLAAKYSQNLSVEEAIQSASNELP